jgi:hypothetical protein
MTWPMRETSQYDIASGELVCRYDVLIGDKQFHIDGVDHEQARIALAEHAQKLGLDVRNARPLSINTGNSRILT